MSAASHDVVHVRSMDRTNQLASTNSFSVNLPKTYQSVYSVQLLSATIPYSFYNIPPTWQTGVTFGASNAGGVASFNFALSNQNTQITDVQSQLLTALQTNLPGSGVTAVNYSTSTGQLSVSFTNGYLATLPNTSGGLLHREYAAKSLA